MNTLTMSIDCMTSFERRYAFVTNILPSLPSAITKDKESYRIEVEKGRIAYKRGGIILVEKTGKDNYEAGDKMLDWLFSHKHLQCGHNNLH